MRRGRGRRVAVVQGNSYFISRWSMRIETTGMTTDAIQSNALMEPGGQTSERTRTFFTLPIRLGLKVRRSGDQKYNLGKISDRL